MILFISTIIVVFCDIASAECTDIYGRSITPNTHFIPGPDICQLCVCDNTLPKWCKRVLCSPPQNCKSFVMGSSCCDYSCLDNTLSNGEYREEIDRRFIITIVAAIFILSILLFMVKKFRHRVTDGVSGRQHRQIAEDGRNLGGIGFITGSIGYLNLPNGHHFDDHSLAHFSLYKQNSHYFPRGEAPPPYDEAIADMPLNVAYTSQYLMNEQNSVDINVQRRRSNSEGLANAASRPRLMATENSARSNGQSSDNVPSATINQILSSSNQHRSIPLTLCANLVQNNELTEKKKVHQPVKRVCQVHKKSNTNKCESKGRHGSSNNSKNVKSISDSTTNAEPFPISLELPHKNISSFQHRTLPLSASLSSPLPSTSDSFDRHKQFATFSSVVNISSSDGDEPASVINDPPAKYSDGDCNEEPTSQLVDDYHAECENCNLNVNAECDGTDEDFSEQETMTLQRKLPEASAIKDNEQSMKVSLTLPTNSRTRRCSSKSQKGGRWNTKGSPHKNKLDKVSSEDEINETEPPFHTASESNEQNI